MTVSAPAESTPPAPAAAPVVHDVSLLPAAGVPVIPPVPRLGSLDVFRGLTIAAMILVNNMGSPAYTALDHAEWNGWTPTDLIFPFFLFIVGVAMPFSFARRNTASEQTRGQILGRVWLRALSLWILGQLLFAWPMPMNHAMPDGFAGTRSFRITCFVFIYGSVIALLIPWRSKRWATWVPIAIAFVFYLLMIWAHYVRAHVMASGWPGNVPFGGGIFDPDNLRIPGVLQRIGLVYGIAGTIALIAGGVLHPHKVNIPSVLRRIGLGYLFSLFSGWRAIVAAIFLLCALYSVLMFTVPYGAKPTTGSLEMEDNLARHVDENVFDRYTVNDAGKRVYTQRHAYRPYPDNEGLLSTIPAIATCLLGVLVGLWLRSDRPTIERGLALLAMGVPVLILGWLLDSWLMPINKILWTPSYVFFTAGLAMLGLGFLFWIVDVLGYRKWALPAVIFGMNAIAAYVAASVVPKMLDLIKIEQLSRDGDPQKVGLYHYLKHGYSVGIRHACDWVTALNAHGPVIATPRNVSLFDAMFLVLVIWFLMAILYVFKIFVKV